MASRCARGGSGWVLGNVPSLKEHCCSGTAAQGVVGSPSMEVFKNHGDVAARAMVSGHGKDGLPIGLDNLRALFQP